MGSYPGASAHPEALRRSGCRIILRMQTLGHWQQVGAMSNFGYLLCRRQRTSIGSARMPAFCQKRVFIPYGLVWKCHRVWGNSARRMINGQLIGLVA
jgi:hypothetical protein